MAKEKAKKGTLKRVLRYIGKYKILLGIALFFACLSVFLTLWFPILIGDAIDLIVGKGNVDMAGITDILWQAFFIVLFTALVNWGMTSLNNRMTFQIARDLRNDAFEKLETLPLSYLDSHPAGDIVSRIIADVDTFSDGLLLGFSQLFTGVVTILGTLVFMLVINWKVALVVFLLTPLSLFVAKFIGSRTYKMFSLQSKTKGEQTAIIDETVGNLKLVKAFSQEDELLDKFDEVNERLGKCSLSAIFYSSLVNPTTRFVNSVVYAAVAMVGALAVIATQDAEVAFTVGELTCLLSYTNQYTKPFNEISGVLTEFQNALASASRLFDLLDEPSEIPDDANAFVMEHAEGAVSFDDVSFSYTKDKKLIDDFSVSVNPGERIAIVGPTGCGKTTVINLLMRFYDVDKGNITVDSHDLRRVTRHSFRKQVGMVLQDTWLKAGTVHENIAFGNPEASREDVIVAAKAAHAHSFIKRLPKGYDTVIKEGGDGLSQGQKQLLCIARVMLTLPPMLILDEATSSIDTRTEIRIQKAFADMMKGRTSFIVAHRLSTIMHCDKILVMREGNIVEQGNHKELLAKGGFYAELYNSQFAK